MKQNLEVTSYGVIEQGISGSAADAHVEEFFCNGYTVLTEVFSAQEIQDYSRRIDEVYETQKKAFGGSKELARARDDDIIRCPLAYDEHFLALAAQERVHAIIARLLGKSYVLMMQNAIINRPSTEQYQVRWHRDLNYQHWTSSRPLALNFLVTVDKFFEEGGATWVLPGSHCYEKFPSDAFVRKYQKCIEAPAGSVIMMDAMCYHRAGVNSTPEFLRRGVNHVVGAPFMGQQIDIPSMLAKHGKDYSNDPFLAAYLGYRWNPAADVETWRRRHMG